VGTNTTTELISKASKRKEALTNTNTRPFPISVFTALTGDALITG